MLIACRGTTGVVFVSGIPNFGVLWNEVGGLDRSICEDADPALARFGGGLDSSDDEVVGPLVDLLPLTHLNGFESIFLLFGNSSSESSSVARYGFVDAFCCVGSRLDGPGDER